MDLNLIWFILLGVLLAGYAILDGFDLGVGILHMAARDDRERRIMMNSIGPVWDGNEVWLVTFGGAMFAAFPDVYASVFSMFYTAFMLLLLCLILRATSMEFRSKRDEKAWRTAWDWAFCLSCAVAALLFGVAVGNVVEGLAIDAGGVYQGGFFDFLTPYPVLVGLMTVALFAMHGSLYLNLKTEGKLQARIQKWAWRAFAAFAALYAVVTIYTFLAQPHALANFKHYPAIWLIAAFNVLAIANIPLAMKRNRAGVAFVSSACSIAALVFLLGLALFPNMVISTIDPAHSLTIYNSASSPKTLGIMLVIAGMGMPLVLGYTSAIYWVFRGKVKLGDFSY